MQERELSLIQSQEKCNKFSLEISSLDSEIKESISPNLRF